MHPLSARAMRDRFADFALEVIAAEPDRTSAREFIGTLAGRLVAGAEQHGDASFLRPEDDLLAEIAQELVDVPGWCFILYCNPRLKAPALHELIDICRASVALWARVRRLQNSFKGG